MNISTFRGLLQLGHGFKQTKGFGAREPLYDVRFGIGASKGEILSRCNLLASLYNFDDSARSRKTNILASLHIEASKTGNNKWSNKVFPTTNGLSTAETLLTTKLFFRQSWANPKANHSGSVANIRRLIMPTSGGKKLLDKPHKLPRPPDETHTIYFNEEINKEQRHAVYDIVNKTHGECPYLIWGPPGTGKTTTVVEAVLQLTTNTHNTILVCTPSDAAADVITHRLMQHLPSKELMRVCHFQRNFASLPMPLLSISPSKDGIFVIPNDAEIHQKRVAVVTIFVSTLLSSSWMGRVSHCFIDESCQATEPEALIPLLQIGHHASVILSGDPRQLGPSIFNSEAGQDGLCVSLQERLMALDLYQDGQYAVFQNLTNNYRSHESILSVSSSLFYNSNLRPMADDKKKNMALAWEGLEGRNFPLLFYDSNDGAHLAELDTPSFFNKHEIGVCVEFVQKLMKSDNMNINFNDIAIITPFRAQVLRMRNALRKVGAGLVGVGQIEDYQGQEKPIVIVSTVLTEFEDRWQGKHGHQSLGFMKDPKKFNVALSRAEGLCIFIGRIEFLNSSDNYFAGLIRHCKANGSIVGDESSEHATTSEGVDMYRSGLDAMLSYVEEAGLGFASERERLKDAMRGYNFGDGGKWRVTL